MHDQLPDPAQVNRAIDIYLEHAYPSTIPHAARTLLTTLRNWNGNFFAAPAFAQSGRPDHPQYSIRLGNRFYPHMKLVVEPAPSGSEYLLRADTHDRHVCPPPGHPEHAAFLELRAKNQRLAEEIEQAWAEAGLSTFKTYLHDDLARRQQMQCNHHAQLHP